MTTLLPYIINQLEQSAVRHEIHAFDSGAVMVDIWVDDTFCVIQLYQDTIGFSVFTPEETIPFDTIPDQSFKDAEAFKRAFEQLFS